VRGAGSNDRGLPALPPSPSNPLGAVRTGAAGGTSCDLLDRYYAGEMMFGICLAIQASLGLGRRMSGGGRSQ